MTEFGWTGKQGVRSAFCGNKSVKADNRLQSEMSAFAMMNPTRRRNRRRPGTTGSSLMSASADSRLRSESSVSGWRSHGKRWNRRTSGTWTMV